MTGTAASDHVPRVGRQRSTEAVKHAGTARMMADDDVVIDVSEEL